MLKRFSPGVPAIRRSSAVILFYILLNMLRACKYLYAIVEIVPTSKKKYTVPSKCLAVACRSHHVCGSRIASCSE